MQRHYLILLAVGAAAGCARLPVTTAVPTSSNTTAQLAASNNFPHIPMARSGYHLDALSAPTNAIVVRYKAGFEAMHAPQPSEHGLTLARTFRFPVNSAAERASTLSALQADPAVEFAEPDYRMEALGMPTDPDVASQWELPTIELPQALDLTTGTGITIASVDTGVNYNHPDLAGQVIKGYDFVNNDADPLDDNGHGTHTSGTMAALTNNGVGVAGIAGGAHILAVKVLSDDGSGSTSDIANGISYAAEHGAKIINLSLGGPSDSQALHAAVKEAAAAGVLVVVAAGNDGNNALTYPAAYPEVLAVGATDKTDAKASFSNYGSYVSIAAPGTGILSTYKTGYGYMDGTSMAAPHVSGAAALVMARHPDWSVAQVRQALIGSGDPTTGFTPALPRLNVYKALMATPTGGGSTPAPAAPPTVAPTAAPTAPPMAPPYRQPTTTPITFTRESVTGVSANRVTLNWTTNTATDGQLQFANPNWTSPVFGPFTTSHARTLTGLSANTRYAFRLLAKDATGHGAVSPNYEFRTSS